MFTLRKTSVAQKWNGNNIVSSLELKTYRVWPRTKKGFRSWTHTRCQGLNIFCVRYLKSKVGQDCPLEGSC